MDEARFGHVQVGHLQIGDWSETDRAMADWPRQWCKTVRQMRKGSYKDYLHKGNLGNCGWGRVFWTTDFEKCKAADLVRESKRRFGLIVRLIAIEYNERLLCYLSSYTKLLISDLWLDLDFGSKDDILPSSYMLFIQCLRVVIVIVIIIWFRHRSNVGSQSY